MNSKPRRPWVAALLTLLAPGLGHWYSGRIRRGLVLFAVDFLLGLPIVFVLSTSVLNKFLALLLFGISIAFFLYCIVDAVVIASGKRESCELSKFNKWYVYAGYFVISILLSELFMSAVIFPYFVEVYSMPTGSMDPTLIIGDHILVNKRIYRKGEPHRGDLIVFKYPENPSITYVKRLIGLPGEIIEIKHRTVYVNDRSLKETYTRYINPSSIQDHYGPFYVPCKGDKLEVHGSAITVNGKIMDAEVLLTEREGIPFISEPYSVPQDHYFTLGDNRDNSLDSRYWGAVPGDYVLGKAIVVLWSFETPWDNYLRITRSDRFEMILERVLHFKSKTRWNRILKILE